MKVYLIIITALMSVNISSQKFTFSDSVFREGDMLTVDELPFYISKDKLSIEVKPFLDSLVNFLMQHDSIIIEIRRHSDSRGSKIYSRCLSCNRARNIARYLISKGIDQSKLNHKGFKNNVPLISDEEIEAMKTEEEKLKAHKLNRRTEFVITAIK